MSFNLMNYFLNIFIDIGIKIIIYNINIRIVIFVF